MQPRDAHAHKHKIKFRDGAARMTFRRIAMTGRHPLAFPHMSETTVKKPRRPFWGLVRRRECLLPTWRGWLLLLLAGLSLAIVAVKKVQPFLAVTDPVAGGALVVEGWAPDYALEEAVVEFQRHHYTKLYVVGVPLEKGAPLSEYKTYAELGAATLLKLGLTPAKSRRCPRRRCARTARMRRRWH